MTNRLVADVGGTNSRLALFDQDTGEFSALETYINRDFSRFEDVVLTWLDSLAEQRPDHGCIAVAAPPTDDVVTMINMNWTFSCTELATQTGLAKIACINDFEGNAYSLPFLQQSQLIQLHAGLPDSSHKLACIGPGTGLGGGTVQKFGDDWFASACEPGHMGLTPASDIEIALFQWLLKKNSDVYAELLVSGPGLQTLYLALAEVKGVAADILSPAEVSGAALDGSKPLCVESLSLFCALLGSICGDFILANGAYGGLYLAGGIVPRILPFLQNSDFHQRLLNKGAMGSHLEQVPIYSITEPYPGLIGAAHAQI
jgi:glucokinase